jgi:leucyl aminopeptidase
MARSTILQTRKEVEAMSLNTVVDCFTADDGHTIEITPLCGSTLSAWLESSSPRERTWCATSGFEGRVGTFCLIPNEHGELQHVLVGGDPAKSPFLLGDMHQRLPAGSYHLNAAVDDEDQRAKLLLGAALGAYRYTRYRNCERMGAAGSRKSVQIVLAENELGTRVRALTNAIYLVRDLINTPAADMMPHDLAQVCSALASEFGATTSEFRGIELLEYGFPSIHAVGRASTQEPRLLQLQWGREDAPCIALVGKGVCFDSGGLDIKPANGMRWMKKDMGGAAHVLGLARLIMETKLDVRLLMLIPAVENAIAGNAMRPGDVLQTRKGLSVEVDNTDAEGRLILADALTFACEYQPELIIDFATLTGAARVAVGTDIAAMFCNDDVMAKGIEEAALKTNDTVWRMPLHQPYRKMIESRVADLQNSGGSPYGGAITAALFLEYFITPQCPWAHFDIMAFNRNSRPSFPEGGEAMGLRATYAYLESRFRTPAK